MKQTSAASKTGRGPFADLPREAAILSAVSFTVALGYGIVAPAIPAFARQFGVSVAAAASVISAFALMRVPVVAGLLVDSASYPAAFGLAGGMLAAAALLALRTPECHNDRGASPWLLEDECGAKPGYLEDLS